MDIIIISGEGDGPGTIERYEGRMDALKARLTRERCGGDRWATAWIWVRRDEPGYDLWARLGDDLTETGDMRIITADEIRPDTSAAAASLGRKGGAARTERKTAASRANGKLGGRPKAQPAE